MLIKPIRSVIRSPIRRAFWPAPGGTITWAAPITITAGGTYSGNWRSTDPAIPAVTIATPDPVTIQNSRTESAGHHFQIAPAAWYADLVFRNVSSLGINPGVDGQATGRWLNDAAGIVTLDVQGCTIAGTGGIYLDGGGSSGFMTLLRVRGNKFHNIDGRLSNGAGGYRTSGAATYSAIQINSYRDIAVVDIDWNYFQNDPGRSRIEDTINIFRSGGVSGRHARIWNNCLVGAYPLNPITDAYAGGGILVDGDSTSATDCARYNSIRLNTIVRTTNHGIGIAAGRDGTISDNRVLSCGKLPRNGQLLTGANVGIYIWDFYGDTPAGAFGNNTGSGNYIGWVNSSGSRADTYLPDGTLTSTTTHSGAITTALEDAEVAAWHASRLSAGQALGSSLSHPGVAANFAPSGLPSISGTTTVGQVLTAVTSDISDPNGAGAFSYQWLRGSSAISGATSSTYTLVSADVGNTVSVRVTYTDGNGALESLTSDPTDAITSTGAPDGQLDYSTTGRYVPFFTIGA